MVEEREDLLRSNTLNEIDNCIGMKADCVLNELQYFDNFECLSVDIGHDIFEGAAQYELKRFIFDLVKDKNLITLDKINKRIKVFNYGLINNDIKPSPIVLDKPNDLIGQRAMQTYCLLIYLPFILSVVIEKITSKPSSRVSQMWEVIFLLIQITEIVFSPVITTSMFSRLKILIKRHHFLFMQHYRAELLPKHHFMTHYVRIIKLMGPLKFIWT